MKDIIGVDFSGAKDDRNTWITEGQLLDSKLTITDCRPIKRNSLTELLKGQPNDTVAAMDFPFSVPVGFANCWATDGCTMPRLWSLASTVKYGNFKDKRDEYVKHVGAEYLRVGDLHVPGCFSCLHDTRPNMLPMTFYGMRMLDALWKEGCRVPPLDDPKNTKAKLLEVMPGAALRAFGLPKINPGKAYKTGVNSEARRKEILSGLACKSKVDLPNLCKFQETCLGCHDALDSVVAAVVAAMWAAKRPFQTPTKVKVTDVRMPNSKRTASPEAKGLTQLEAAKREGWIYVP